MLALSLSPGFAGSGEPGFTLTVAGAGFSANSKVLWNGVERPTSFVSATVLHADISAADIAATGEFPVSVSGSALPPATFRVVELMNLEQYPSLDRQGTFYGQSASLVNFLVARGGTSKFLQFVEQATSVGYDRALRDVYAIQSVNELEMQWIAALDRPATVQLADAREETSPRAVRARKLAD